MNQQTVGQILQARRQSKGYTLDDVGRQTRLHVKNLEALEEDRLDDILSAPYVRSFIKTYAKFLGLDPQALLSEYEKKFQVTETSKQQELVQRRQLSEKKRDSTLIIVAALAVAVALAILLSFVFRSGKTTEPAAPRTKTGAAARPKRVQPSAPKKTIPVMLLVKARADVWMQVKADGKIIFQNILPKDAIAKYRAEEAFHFWVGKGEALDFTLNGKPLGSPGSGVLKNIRITAHGMEVSK